MSNCICGDTQEENCPVHKELTVTAFDLEMKIREHKRSIWGTVPIHRDILIPRAMADKAERLKGENK